MNQSWQRIPTHDFLNRRLKVNDRAILFSKHGINYEGFIKQIGGKRWFVVDEQMKIGGIGNHSIIKTD